jgi:hypothetical protein
MSVKSGFLKVVQAVASDAPVRDSVLAAFAAAVGVAAGGGESAQVAFVAAAYGVLRAAAAFVAGKIVAAANSAGQ